jgi:hypothetical protein
MHENDERERERERERDFGFVSKIHVLAPSK